MAKTAPRTSIVFPNLHASLGGAVSVEYSTHYAWIKTHGATVRIARARLPKEPQTWDAFRLADIAARH